MFKDENKIIWDNGKPRNCPNNYKKMSYVRVYYYFSNHKHAIKEFIYAANDLKDALGLLFQAVMWVILFPILPFIRIYYLKKRD